MRKFVLLICAVLTGILNVTAQEPQFVSKNPQTRGVLIEEFTGRLCVNCPYGHIIANTIVNDNPGRAWAVNIHGGAYAPTSYPNFNTSHADAIINGFNVSAYPQGVVNRSTSYALSRGDWTVEANQQLEQMAECNVGGRVVINKKTRMATLSLEVYYTANSMANKNYLTVMMLQDSVSGYQQGGSTNPAQMVDGQYVHMHVLRDVVTPLWGDEIIPTTAGTLVTKTYSYKIPEVISSPNGVDVDINNIHFLAFVTEKQDGTPTRPILNVGELDKIVIETNEPIYPFIRSVKQEDVLTCTKEKKFYVGVVNGGTEEVTSMKFEVSVKNGNTTEYEWNGVIPVYGSVNIDMFAEIPFGGQIVDFKIVKANGVSVNSEKSIMAESEEWIEIELDETDLGEDFRVEFAQDKYGDQITWKAVGHNNKVIATGGPYENLSANGVKVHEVNFTAPAGECVRFIVEDKSGDGINGEYGAGYYKVYDSEGNVIIQSDGKYAYEECNVIYLDGVLPVVNVTVSVDPEYAGSVTGDGNYIHGEKVTLVATPNDGYKFLNWTENGNVVSENAEYSFEITSYRDLVANFTLVDYEINVAINQENAGKVIADVYKEGFELASLSQGWTVYSENQIDAENWGVVSSYSDLAPKNGKYYAASISEGNYDDARIYLVTPKIKVPADASMGFSYVNPKSKKAGSEYYSRLYLYVSTSSTGPWNEVWCTKAGKSNSRWTDVVVDLTEYVGQEVYFAFCNKFGGWGSWTAIDDFVIYGDSESGVSKCYYGDNVKLTAKVNDGYRFVGWTENGAVVSEEAEYQFEVTGNVDMVANFVPVNSYLVTVEINPKDAGEIIGAGAYELNETVVLKASANEGYEFINWTENGTVVSEEKEYSFTITGDKNIVANFKPLDYKVTVTIAPDNAGFISGAGDYVYGDVVTLIATANDGFKFISWMENGEVVSTSAQYSFTITRDVDLVANFESYEDIEELMSSIRFYPNPVADKLYVVAEVEIDEIGVYDIYGRRQVTETLSHQGDLSIDVSNLKSGIYIVIIKTSSGIVTKRFVKE
ncbi:MAG: Omp28-related outer membrane protein [Bacteroidales bacterium]|nr:Omp28-related outer membrane protein [Bacteroidales bacterium]